MFFLKIITYVKFRSQMSILSLSLITSSESLQEYSETFLMTRREITLFLIIVLFYFITNIVTESRV